MWGVVIVSLLFFRFTEVFGQNKVEFTLVKNNTDSLDGLTGNMNEMRNMKFGSALDNFGKQAAEKLENKSGTRTILQPTEERRLKYKKTELKFLMKLLIILKVVLGLVLPLGIISSKILSWKAVTLSLMAFMLAKILFVKNLLTGKNTYPVTPAGFFSPVLIHGASNDGTWKRQGDVQNVYPWSST